MPKITGGVFLKISEGGAKVERIEALPDGQPQYDQMKAALDGGWREMFLRVPSPSRSGIDLLLSCDEEGYLKNLPPNVQVGGHTIVGPLLITANQADYEFGLDEKEVEFVMARVRA